MENENTASDLCHNMEVFLVGEIYSSTNAESEVEAACTDMCGREF
jgi:hypothetical protein